MSDSARERSRRRWRRLTPVLAVIVALVISEFALRWWDERQPSARPFIVPETLRGWALRPGFRGWVDEENHVWVEINSAGMRDREHPIAAPPSTLRVAVLGDSFMEAVNVPFELTFPPLLEATLSDCLRPSGRVAEVLNFGVSGYGTALELLTYRHRVQQYRPDIVLLAVYLGNDIRNNHPALDRNASVYPKFTNGVLTFETVATDAVNRQRLPWYQRARLALTDRSNAATLLYRSYANLRNGLDPRMVEAANARAVELDVDPLTSPTTPEGVEAWQTTEGLLSVLAREVAAQGSEFWIVTLSVDAQVHPDLHWRAAEAAKRGIDSWFYPDRRIEALARSQGIRSIHLAEPMAEYAAAHHVFFNGGYNARYPPGTGHWNEAAHRKAVELASPQLCAQSPVILKANASGARR